MVLKMNRIKNIILENIEIKKDILNSDKLIADILSFYNICFECISNGGKILACGNGGSAADASHFVAELVGKFHINRHPYSAISLNSDSTLLTALSNDFQYHEVFSRQILALMQPNDILLTISTSGSSPNIVAAIKAANKIGGKTILLTSELCNKRFPNCELVISIPCQNTPRTQECHTMILHIVCELLENALYN